MTETKKMGRPKADTEVITLRMQRSMLAALDDYRRDVPDLPTRPEMIRRILADVLNLEEES
ncbi:hypothetical protein [Paracoccus fistulariae]|uniref:Ribbon-helix-helix protein CopG domain-containing protein n=1 Tax=Paracoccus fistulariae TaxID=658446 RepID=A0ABY7SQP7_9RHOB|nr:hypothetical protein [Paracoccus fistulariae]MDB6183192.1 hypothetical protein [Paracoccus fistulariae]WCR09219.1 hypothetical protein JHX87_18050 [Paracoccus fistulariae]